jgi:hypothetical protein
VLGSRDPVMGFEGLAAAVAAFEDPSVQIEADEQTAVVGRIKPAEVVELESLDAEEDSDSEAMMDLTASMHLTI